MRELKLPLESTAQSFVDHYTRQLEYSDFSVPVISSKTQISKVKSVIFNSMTFTLYEKVKSGFRDLYEIHNVFDLITNLPSGSYFRLVAEGIRGDENEGFGVRLYQFRYGHFLLNIIAPIFWGINNPKFDNCDNDTRKMIDLVKNKKNSHKLITLEICRNYSEKISRFEYSLNFNKTMVYLNNFCKFWKIDLKFIPKDL